MRLLRSARNDKLSPVLTEGLPCFLPTFVLPQEISKCAPWVENGLWSRVCTRFAGLSPLPDPMCVSANSRRLFGDNPLENELPDSPFSRLRKDDHLGQSQQMIPVPVASRMSVLITSPIVYCDGLISLFQAREFRQGFLQTLFISKHGTLLGHDLLQ